MKVKTSQLHEGLVLASDVFSLTSEPIIPKDTVLTNVLIEFLHAFLIKEVEIKEQSDIEMDVVEQQGMPFDEQLDNEWNKEQPEKNFNVLFEEAVHQYKHLFKNWQSGGKVAIIEVRKVMVPLVRFINMQPQYIFDMHQMFKPEYYIYQHPIAVGVMSAYIGKKMKLSGGECIQLGLAGALSDCGMSKLTPSILTKKEPLTDQEWDEIKQHPLNSYKMLKDIPSMSEDALLAVLQHHEKEDGSGYPLGFLSNQLTLFGRIIAVVDTYLAITAERVYQKRRSPFQAIEIIQQDEFGKFDPRVINVLINIVGNLSIGTTVKLSNQEKATIMFIQQKYPTRPLVKVLKTGEIIDLTKNRELFIEEIL